MIYFLALGAIAVCMNVSVWVCNLAWCLLLANWLVDWGIAPKEHRLEVMSHFKTNPMLSAFIFVFALYLIGMAWTSNWSYGMDSIRKMFPFLVVPMVVLTSNPLDDRRLGKLAGDSKGHKLLGNILFCYIMGIVAACIVGLVRFFTIPDLPYRKIIPFLSHIRFSLNLCFGIILLVYQMIKQKGEHKFYFAVCLLLALSFLAYLFLLQSYTGLIILLIVAYVAFFAFWKDIRKRWLKSSILTLSAGLVLLIVGLTAYNITDYYRLSSLAKNPLKATTVNGNPYLHKQDGFVECGNYVNNYICNVEMDSEWAKVSDKPLDYVTDNGYSIRPTLVRFLNAKGLTKDSVGISQLTAEEVASIEKGIANPVYLNTLSIKRMYAVMLYEYESYRCYHAVKGFTMLQRFELWRNGWKVFLQHPLFGTGTGDVVDLCHDQLKLDESPLMDTKKHAHSQYLTYLITFGLLGFLLIVLAFANAFRLMRSFRFFPTLAMMVIFLMSCLTEDTLETLAGIMFFAFFISIFTSCHSIQTSQSRCCK